jgi:lysophospholipase L1-like esterase
MIVFGHQSVGADIVRGVAEIARERGLDLDVRESTPSGVAEAAPSSGPLVFAHGPVGRNRDPRAKTDDFARWIDRSAPGTVEVAFHKYCYADIEHGADVDAILAHYRDVMAGLRARRPDVVFAHVTVPVQSARPTWRSQVKRMLGRAHGRYEDNRARARFNQRLRELYTGREPVFDLAAIESTRPDGTPERMGAGGGAVPALVPAYASDGSHLGPLGRRRVAEALLAFLAELGVPLSGAVAHAAR